MRHKLIVWYAIIYHLIVGISVLISRQSLNTATLTTFNSWFPKNVVGVLLVTVALLATLGITIRNRKTIISAILLIPQQLLILLSGFLALSLALAQHYGDGVPRPFFFIFTDQFPAMLLAVFYTYAIVEPYFKRLR